MLRNKELSDRSISGDPSGSRPFDLTPELSVATTGLLPASLREVLGESYQHAFAGEQNVRTIFAPLDSRKVVDIAPYRGDLPYRTALLQARISNGFISGGNGSAQLVGVTTAMGAAHTLNLSGTLIFTPRSAPSFGGTLCLTAGVVTRLGPTLGKALPPGATPKVNQTFLFHPFTCFGMKIPAGHVLGGKTYDEGAFFDFCTYDFAPEGTVCDYPGFWFGYYRPRIGAPQHYNTGSSSLTGYDRFPHALSADFTPYLYPTTLTRSGGFGSVLLAGADTTIKGDSHWLLRHTLDMSGGSSGAGLLQRLFEADPTSPDDRLWYVGVNTHNDANYGYVRRFDEFMLAFLAVTTSEYSGYPHGVAPAVSGYLL